MEESGQKYSHAQWKSECVRKIGERRRDDGRRKKKKDRERERERERERKYFFKYTEREIIKVRGEGGGGGGGGGIRVTGRQTGIQ